MEKVFLKKLLIHFSRKVLSVLGTDIEAADFNGDGLVDFYLADRSGSDHLLMGVDN